MPSYGRESFHLKSIHHMNNDFFARWRTSFPGPIPTLDLLGVEAIDKVDITRGLSQKRS